MIDVGAVVLRRQSCGRGGIAGRHSCLNGEVAGLRRDAHHDRVTRPRARGEHDVDDVVVDHHGREHHTRAELAISFGEERGVYDDLPGDRSKARCGHLRRQQPQRRERVGGQRCAAIRVILVDERIRAIGSRAPGHIGVATGHEYEIPVQHAVAQSSRAVHGGAETMLRAEHLQRGPHRQQLGGGAGGEQALGIDARNGAFGVEIVKLHAPDRMLELGPVHDGLNAAVRCRLRAQQGCRAEERRKHNGAMGHGEEVVVMCDAGWWKLRPQHEDVQ